MNMAGIEVAEVKVAAIPEILEVAGRVGVNENETARVGSLVEGRVSEILANVGDRVPEGGILARIRSYEVDSTRADYAKAQAELSRWESETLYLQKSRDRIERLVKMKAAPIEELQRAEAELDRAKAGALSARADIGRLDEKLDHMGVSVEGATHEYLEPGAAVGGGYEEAELVPVKAPLAGTVLQRMVTPGVVVNPSDDLFVVSDLSTLWVWAEVPESFLERLREGQKMTLRVEAYPGVEFSGRLAHVSDVLNPTTRTVQVRCEVRNLEGRLRSEMYATVRFDLGSGPETPVVPRTAVQTLDSGSVVFVEVAPSKFESKAVKLGKMNEESVEVLEGLTPGEKVVTKGAFLLKSQKLRSRIEE